MTFEQLTGKKVGVRGGTTTEEGLRKTLAELALKAEIVAVKIHDDGLKKLNAGELAAYFGDRAILQFMASRSTGNRKLRVSNRYFSHEPYALGIARGDDDFRLVVDTALSRLYRSGAIVQIFVAAFGQAEPSDILKSMFLINSLPE